MAGIVTWGRGAWGGLKHRRVARAAVAYVPFAWLVLQVWSTIVPPLGLADWTFKALIAALGAGFPLALVGAWIWDIRSPIDQAATDQAPELAPAGDLRTSIAILPFRDLSAAGDQDYFCEGAAEEIAIALTRIPALRVASQSATSRFKDPKADSREVGRLLQVGTYLEGSVRKAEDRVRVAVRLVNAGDGFALWSDSFDRDLSDIFALQEEIARAIVAALDVTLLDQDAGRLRRQGTRDPKAYDLYLKGRQQMRKELEAERRTAAELFREATRRDPDFALAYAGLAEVLVQISRWRPGDAAAAEAEAAKAADRAVELAPELAEAQIARGAALRLRHDPRARAAYERALELSPSSAEAHYSLARFLVLEGQKVEAIGHYERAFELAPDDYRYIVYAMQEYQALGDSQGEKSCLERSWAALERRLELDPQDVKAYSHGAGVLAMLGREEECRRYIEKALAYRPDDYGNLMTLACAAVLNRDTDQALDLLERALAGGRGDREWVMNDNDLAPLHGHPRFEALIAGMA